MPRPKSQAREAARQAGQSLVNQDAVSKAGAVFKDKYAADKMNALSWLVYGGGKKKQFGDFGITGQILQNAIVHAAGLDWNTILHDTGYDNYAVLMQNVAPFCV